MDHKLCLDSNVLNPASSRNNNNLDLRIMLPCQGNITPEVIERLEADLDFYEKVSLVFLLYDNVDIALQRLKGAEIVHLQAGLPSCGLLSDWARHANHPHWEDKFLEALCIIQNYSIVEKLGYDKEDVKTRYLPETPETSLYVDLIRKALYLLCEKLTEDKEKILSELVKADILGESTSWSSNIETQFLEIKFLYWISQKYMCIQSGSVDVTNLTKHFKVMEEQQLVDYLESATRICNTALTRNDDTFNGPTTSTLSLQGLSSYRVNIETHSVFSDFSQGSSRASNLDEEVYYIDPENVGYCVIINQKNFYQETDPTLKKYLSKEPLEDRIGTDVDRDRLGEAFSHLGFTVETYNNLDHLQLLKTVEFAARNLVQENHSCFVLCILSHGLQNQVFGVNSIPVSVDDIEERIQGKYCPQLLNKPKILIIQACQGHESQDAVRYRRQSRDSDISLDGPGHTGTCPVISDSFVMWSTVRGFAAFRNKVTGSWFIQTLCDLLLKATTGVDMVEISNAVNRKIKSMSANLGQGVQKTMQPMHTSTLSRRLFLPCSDRALTSGV